MIDKRMRVIAYYRNDLFMKKVDAMKNTINIIYASKKMNYVIFYLNTHEVKKVVNELTKYKEYIKHELTNYVDSNVISTVKQKDLTAHENSV